MDKAAQHRLALPLDVEELPEAAPGDVESLDDGDDLPEAAPGDVESLDELPEASEPVNNAAGGYSYADRATRKTFPLRMSAAERDEGKRAAARMSAGSASVYSWDRRPWTEADWWRGVGLDWARYVNELPEGEEGAKPSRVVKALQERIARLERELAAARGAPAPAEEKRKRPRKAAPEEPESAPKPKAWTATSRRRGKS